MAKFCTNCGKQMDSDATFCIECGTHNSGEFKGNAKETFQTVFNERYRYTNIPATLGFMFSVMLIAIPGLVLSIIGLINAKKNDGNGKKIALIGLIMSSVEIVMYLLSLIVNIAKGFFN